MRPLNIFILSFDWNDDYRKNRISLITKLERNRFNPDINNFLFFAWSKVSYQSKDGHLSTVHRRSFPRLLFFRPLFDLITFFYVPRILSKYEERPDLIVVYDIGFIPAALALKKRRGGKVVFFISTISTLNSLSKPWGIFRFMYYRFIEFWLATKPDYYLSIGEATTKYLVSIGVNLDRIKSISLNVIVRDKERIDRSVKGKIRKKLGIQKSKKILLSVGRLEYEKDFDRLLNLFCLLSDNYVLIIVGDGSLRDKLSKKARELGIDKRVFFEGYVGRNEIWNYYNDADVFILLSRAEALGLVFWEAMYMRVPVVGSNAPGIVESVGSNGERGCLVPRDENEKTNFLNTIDFCIGGSDYKKIMVENAFVYVTNKINRNETINDICDSHALISNAVKKQKINI